MSQYIGMLHGQAEIRVVGGLAVDHHRQVDEGAALRPDQVYPVALLDQAHRLGVQLQHHVDVARQQSVHPCGDVADADHFDLVHPGPVRPPVVVIALEEVARARLPVLDLERTGSGRRTPNRDRAESGPPTPDPAYIHIR